MRALLIALALALAAPAAAALWDVLFIRDEGLTSERQGQVLFVAPAGDHTFSVTEKGYDAEGNTVYANVLDLKFGVATITLQDALGNSLNADAALRATYEVDDTANPAGLTLTVE